MIGYCRDHKWNVVDAKLGVVEEGHPHLRVPAESCSIFPAPRVEAIDVKACDICRFGQPMETEGRQAPVGDQPLQVSWQQCILLLMYRCKGHPRAL